MTPSIFEVMKLEFDRSRQLTSGVHRFNVNKDRRRHLLMGKLIKFHIAGVKKHKPLLGVKIIPRYCLYEKSCCVQE